MIPFIKKLTLTLEVTTILFGLAITLIFGIFHVILTNERINEFESYHNVISHSATKNISYEIERLLLHKYQLVKSFLEDNKAFIISVAKDPENDELYEKLNKKLSRYFMDYFASNIATESGEFIIDDFDGHIGQLCLMDMKHFSESGRQIIRIHPNPSIYHYDIRANINNNSKMIFVVTFSTDEITNLLNASTPDKHNLIIFNNRNKIIEITRKGSRDKLVDRLDYRLTEDEQSRRLTSHPVRGTDWDVVDLHSSPLFSNYRNQLIRQGAIAYLFFIILTSIMSFSLFIGARKKNTLEKYLLEKNRNIDILNKKLETISQTDSLTGIYNRRYLDSHGSSEFSTARRLNIPLNIALIDIDYFKQYNDTYGHQTGDTCLINIAAIIDGYFRRSNEFTARYGGEEFIVINLGDDNFIERVNELAESIKLTHIEHSGSEISQYLTVSIGVASMASNPYESIAHLIKEADIALYQAKKSGRDKIVSFLTK